MCDQYDNRGCEVVDEKDIIIASLEDEILGLKNKIENLECDIESINLGIGI